MRSTLPEPHASHGSPDRLVRRTGRGLALTTLLLIVALLGGVGIATAAVAIRQTDASVDRSLRDAATAAIAYLELIDVDAPPTVALVVRSVPPVPTDEAEPSESAGTDTGSESTDAVEPGDDNEASEGPDERSTNQPESTPRPGTTLLPTNEPGDNNGDFASEPPDGLTRPALSPPAEYCWPSLSCLTRRRHRRQRISRLTPTTSRRRWLRTRSSSSSMPRAACCRTRAEYCSQACPIRRPSPRLQRTARTGGPSTPTGCPFDCSHRR